MYSTQLTDFRDYDIDNLIFQLPERRFDEKTQRIRVMTHHLDGTRGDLILSTPRLLTFGLQEQFDPTTHNLVGYQLPLILWGKDGPSEEEQQFIDLINRITEAAKNFIVNQREELEQPSLEYADLNRLNPLYYKMEKGEIQKDRAPLLYSKLNVFRQENQLQIRTLFTDERTRETLDPLRLINRRCFVHAAIRLESIILGNTIRPRFQVKLFEARVRFPDTGFKSLLEPGKVFPKVNQRQSSQRNKTEETTVKTNSS